MKEIIPLKLVIEMNNDGTFKEGVLLYRLKTDGSTDMRTTYTIDISGGIKKVDIDKILSDVKIRANLSENI